MSLRRTIPAHQKSTRPNKSPHSFSLTFLHTHTCSPSANNHPTDTSMRLALPLLAPGLAAAWKWPWRDPSSPPSPPCYGVALYECLPGLEFVGIGFDAVVGSSDGVGRQVVNFSFDDAAANTYKDPFGNVTVYNYPDQAHVSPRRAGKTEYNVFRSVNDYVSYQSTNANAHLKVGPWFSASVETKQANQIMKDGMHIIAEATLEIGVFDITLDTFNELSPTDKFAKYVAQLPTQYDPAAYGQFVADWGTHYVSYATLGGRASMSSTIKTDYYGTKTDSDIQAQVAIQFGLFGGGGGGGSNSSQQDSQFTSNSHSETYSIGGDPAVRNFKDADQWNQWALSVETTSPVVTSYNIEMLHFLVNDTARRANVLQAINEYGAAHNVTFRAKDLTTIKMGWCDCYSDEPVHVDPSTGGTAACSKDGFIIKGIGVSVIEQHHGYQIVPDGGWYGHTPITCCRPCFTSSN
eukprot:INCI7169.5.p1 GENE.INCI7169.5~~INCI7169.5.p1  ORF type:complete len:463 (-),score=64.22 INCI7169.5:195-1583(-)